MAKRQQEQLKFHAALRSGWMVQIGPFSGKKFAREYYGTYGERLYKFTLDHGLSAMSGVKGTHWGTVNNMESDEIAFLLNRLPDQLMGFSAYVQATMADIAALSTRALARAASPTTPLRRALASPAPSSPATSTLPPSG